MDTTWIVVASREETRVFSRTGKGALSLVWDVGNPLGRLKLQDLVSDRSGAAGDNRKPGRLAYSTEESPRDRALKDFYREIAARLERSAEAREYEHLILIAEPRLLGMLRGILPSSVKRAISEEIHKDLSFADERELTERLQA